MNLGEPNLSATLGALGDERRLPVRPGAFGYANKLSRIQLALNVSTFSICKVDITSNL